MSSAHDLGEGPRALRYIGQLYRSFARLVDAPLRGLGLSYAQVPVLVALKEGTAMSQAELVRISQVEQSSMAQLLARMERDGLIQRTPDPHDARSRQVVLSAAGRRQLAPSRDVMAKASASALEGFSAQECAQLHQWLARIEANIQHALETAGQPD